MKGLYHDGLLTSVFDSKVIEYVEVSEIRYKIAVNKRIVLVCVIFLILMASIWGVVASLYSLPVMDILKFVLVLLLITWQGFLVYNLIGFRFKSLGANLLLCVYLGITGLFFQYAVIAGLKLLHVFQILFIFSSIVSTIVYMCVTKVRKIDFISAQKSKAEIAQWICLSAIITLVFVIVLSMLSLTYPPLNTTGSIEVYPDLVWHMRNVNSLSDKYPMEDPSVSGTFMKYHFFSDLFFACIKRITGISAYNLILFCSNILYPFLIVVGFYAFFANFIENKLIAILASCICYMLTPITVQHMFTNVNSVTIVTPAYLLFFLAFEQLLCYNNTESTKLRIIIVATVMHFLVIGFKGPYGSLIIAGITVLFVLRWLRNKRIDSYELLFLVINIILFLVLFFYLYYSVSADSISISRNTFLQHVELSAKRPLSIVERLIELPKLLFRISGGLILAAGIHLVKTIISYFQKEKNIRYIYLLFHIIIFGGLLLYGLVHQAGYSELYFLFAVIPLIQLTGCICILEIALIIRSKFNRSILILYLMSVVLVFIPYFNSNAILTMKTVRAFATPLDTLESINAFSESQESDDITIFYVTQKEVEGLLWIRDNLPKDALYATTRHYITPSLSNRFYYYSAISERNYYLEGFGYSQLFHASNPLINEMLEKNTELFALENPNRHEQATRLGINYMVVTRSLTSYLDLDANEFQLVFNNEHMKIYKVIN